MSASSKRYLITKDLLEFSAPLEITADRYAQIVAAKNVVVRMVSVEEKFSMLVDNYAEYEHTLLTLTLSRMLDFNYDYGTVHDAKQLVNRRLANLMSAARMYLDQVERDVEAVCGESAKVEVKNARSAQYDSRFGYRVMEALRNYVQHYGLPIGSMSYPGARVERPGAPALLRHGIIARLDARRFQDDGDFKKKVLSELIERGPSVSITPLVREYVEGLAVGHKAVRAHTTPVAEAAEHTLTQVIGEARAAWGDAVIGLCVAVEDQDGDWLEKHDVFSDLGERRASLADRIELDREGLRHIGTVGEVTHRRQVIGGAIIGQPRCLTKQRRCRTPF